MVLCDQAQGTGAVVPTSSRGDLPDNTWSFVTDAHNGLRAFSDRAAREIDITLDRMAHATELIDQIRLSGLPFK